MLNQSKNIVKPCSTNRNNSTLKTSKAFNLLIVLILSLLCHVQSGKSCPSLLCLCDWSNKYNIKGTWDLDREYFVCKLEKSSCPLSKRQRSQLPQLMRTNCTCIAAPCANVFCTRTTVLCTNACTLNAYASLFAVHHTARSPQFQTGSSWLYIWIRLGKFG